MSKKLEIKIRNPLTADEIIVELTDDVVKNQFVKFQKDILEPALEQVFNGVTNTEIIRNKNKEFIK